MYHTGSEGGVYARVPDVVRTAAITALYFDGNFSDPLQSSVFYPRVECASGNCSYPAFDSLAVCNICANVTDALGVLTHDVLRPSWTQPHQEAANYTLNSGFHTDLINSGYTWPRYISSGKLASTVKVQPLFPIANFTQINFSNNSIGLPTATAMECALHWCVNRYKTSVENGVLGEEVISSSTASGHHVDNFHSISAPSNSNVSFSLGTGYVNRLNNPLPGSYPCGRINVDPAYCPTGDDKHALQDITGGALVSSEAHTQLAHYIGGLLTGYSSLNLPLGTSFDSVSYNESDVVRSLHRTNNATLSMDILARALTTAIRDYDREGGVGRMIINGWTWHSEVHVHVKWAWITLPVALEIATLVFLLITIWDTSTAKTDHWKNSSLAVLFHGGQLENDVMETTAGKIDAIVMEKIAQKKNVMLRDMGDGRVRLD